MNALLTASDLAFERRQRTLFRDIDIELAAGEILLITGANGIGKTTLIKVLAGILRPAQGRVEAEPLFLVGHQTGLKGELSADENLRFYAALLGGSGAARALESAQASHLRHHAVQRLSAGQQRRVALARLFLAFRPLWLLDEPYANLDQPGCEMVDEAIEQQLEAGGAVIMASHGRRPRLEEAVRELCMDRVSA